MEEILYNAEDKEVAIILGYGIGSHLSAKFLAEIIQDIRKIFPMTDEQAVELPFMEIAQSSRSHRYCWYTRFKYDLSDKPEKDQYIRIDSNNNSAFVIRSHRKGQEEWIHKDETAADCMNRMLHR